MSTPQFEFVSIGNDCYLINDGGRTVAIVTSQGFIDWLLTSPMQEGPLLTSIRKETHLSYTLGFKMQLNVLHIDPVAPSGTQFQKVEHRIEPNGDLVLTANCSARDGLFTSRTVARLGTDDLRSRYQWSFETVLRYEGAEPLELTTIEFNNVYPSFAGRCMLFEPQKQFQSTLMTDRDGVVWQFPHQHTMHYSGKISQLHFANGTMGGFFNEAAGNPVVIVEESTFEPTWAICDMYYDLHCIAKVNRAVRPGEEMKYFFQVKYLGRAESEKLMAAARPVEVLPEDQAAYAFPRLELGFNHFDEAIAIDRPDDASCFRIAPPQKVWDREVGHRRRGSLRITNETDTETVWSAEPPTLIPPETTLRISGMVKTEDVEGRGIFVRVRYHTFVWHPEPHVDWVRELESKPVAGTTAGWMKIEVPELHVPADDFDFLLWIDVVMDGKGVGWLTDVEIDLQPCPDDPRGAELDLPVRVVEPALAG